jgi:hypothetical protein
MGCCGSRSSRGITEMPKAIEEMVEKQKEFEKVAEEMKAELELKKENLIEARGKIEELTSET